MLRRRFLRGSSLALGAYPLLSSVLRAESTKSQFSYALGQWTFQRLFRSTDRSIKRQSVEFPTMAGELGFAGVDYSGILMGEDHSKSQYLAELNRRAHDAGVKNVLILIDLQDALGAKDPAQRKSNVEKYRSWLEAAATLGCQGVRINPIAHAESDAIEQSKLLADGITQLIALSDPLNLDVLIENHGEGLRCNGLWIASVVKRVNHSRCGTLPDFGNFQRNRQTGEYYDRYQGVAAMLPFAKAVCAKSHDFDTEGNECYSDFDRLLEQVNDSGFRGWIEVEYEGPGGPPNPKRKSAGPLSERDGALATKRLVEKCIAKAIANQ